MKKIFLVALLIPILSFTCLKKSPNCHTSVMIKNNSDFTVFRALVIRDNDSNCRYILEEFKPGTSYTWRGYGCYEKHENTLKELYIISPERTAFQAQTQSLNCDSIAKHNKVLKHYDLTLQYLHEHNWEVNYPE